MESLSACPSCASKTLVPYLQAKDWLVTKETFTLVLCPACDLVFTNPRPDENQIGKYYQSEEYVSHTNKSAGLIGILYQQVRAHTLNKKLALITKLNNGEGTLLDVGCATGHFLEICKKAGWQVQGTEPDAGARQVAIQKGLPVAETIEELQTQGSFTVVTLWHVLEHMHTLRASLQKIAALLAPEGTLIIAVPNRRSADAMHYGADWAAYDVPRHLSHFSQAALSRLAAQEGLAVVGTRPMVFDAFYVAMLSEKNRGGSLLSALQQGVASNAKARNTGEYSSLMYILKKEKKV